MKKTILIFISLFFLKSNAQQIEVEYVENVLIKDVEAFNKLTAFEKITYRKGLFKFKLIYKDGYSSYINHDFSNIYNLHYKPEDVNAQIDLEDGENVTFIGSEVIDKNAHKRFEKQFYKDYFNKKIYANLLINKQIEDVFFDWNWQITNEVKEIAGYTCKKAISNINGYHFEAWFTDEISISTGPSQFDSLPGLILYVNTGYLEIMATSIRFMKSDEVIKMPEFTGKIYSFNEIYTPKNNSLNNAKNVEFKTIFQNSDSSTTPIKTTSIIKE